MGKPREVIAIYDKALAVDPRNVGSLIVVLTEVGYIFDYLHGLHFARIVMRIFLCQHIRSLAIISIQAWLYIISS
jgi:hypothetical protein